jgi:hypothetical protein
MTVNGPHCSGNGHDGCSWITCDHTGFVEHPCRQPGCPYCGAPAPDTPEAWASVPDGTPVAILTQPGAAERVAAYLQAYPLVRRSPGDDPGRLDHTESPG